MLQLLHRYRKTLFGALFVVVAALLMTSFGLDSFLGGNSRNGSAAITVNNDEINFGDVDRERRMAQAQYQKILGERYEEMLKQFGINISQEVVDRIVENKLIEQAARKAGLRAGTGALEVELREQLGGSLSKESYASLLSMLGLTASQFEERLKNDLTRNQLVLLLKEVTKASDAEAVAEYVRSNTVYAGSVISIDPASFQKSVTMPTSEELLELYENSSVDYEEPNKVRFHYAALKAEKLKNEVPVPEEDIQLFYTDNQSKFKLPETRKVSVIEIKRSNDKDTAPKAKAEEALTKISGGTPFASVALEYSDDFATKSDGGSLGTVKKGSLEKSLNDVVFSLAAGANSAVIESPTSYKIARVDEIVEATYKPISEVREQIVAAIKEQEFAPFLHEKALSLVETFKKESVSLADFAKVHDLDYTEGTTAVAQGATGYPIGLVSYALNTSDKRTLFEEGDLLVEIAEKIPNRIPAFEEVKPRLIERLVTQRAATAAKEAADKLLTTAPANLEKVAKDLKYLVTPFTDIKPSKPGKGVLSQQKFLERLSTFKEVPAITSEVYFEDTKPAVVLITQRKVPTSAATPKELAQYRAKASEEIYEVALKSLVNSLKASAAIEIDPSLYRE